MLQTFVFVNKIKLDITEITKEGVFIDEPDFQIEARKMTHGTTTFAYKFVKKGKLRIDKKKLAKSKLPSGLLIARLKQGKNIKYKGKTYKAKDFLYSTNAVQVSFVFDTSLNKKIVPFVKNSELLISEACLSAELGKLAKERKHLTSAQAAEIAKNAKVGKLMLTHISQRYDKDPSQILREARKIFKKSYLANDLDVVEV